MILPNFTESEILHSLIADQITLKPLIRSLAKKYIAKCERRHVAYDDDIIFQEFRLPSGNTWGVSIRFQKSGNSFWHSMKYCVAEGKHRTKDYYYLRGLSNNNPYYIKLSSHTIIRFLERGMKNGWEDDNSDFPIREYIISRIFKLHETAVSIKDIPLEYDRAYMATEDSENDFSITRLIMTIAGMFFADKSKEGNYNVKTFVGIEELLSRSRDDFRNNRTPDQSFKIVLLQRAHIHYNPDLWDEEEKQSVLNVSGIEKAEWPLGENGISLLKP